MKYMLLIRHGDTGWEEPSQEEQHQVHVAYQPDSWSHYRAASGVGWGGHHRTRAGRQTLTTDGPFVTLEEALDGWLFSEADDLEAAIELATRIRQSCLGGAVEIRP